MTEAELRGHLLKTVYDLRNNAGGWVPISEMNFSGINVSRGAVGLMGQHLAEAGLIDWKPLHGGAEGFLIGNARITGHGVDVVQKKASPRIAITLPGEGSAAVEAGSSAKPTEAVYVPDNQTGDVAAQIAADEHRRASRAALDAGGSTVFTPVATHAPPLLAVPVI